MVTIKQGSSHNIYNYVAYNRKKNSIQVANLFLNYMKIERLAALSQTSKTWNKLTDKAHTWINVCKESDITPQCKPAFFAAIKQDNLKAWKSLVRLLSKNYNKNIPSINIKIARWRLENKADFLTDQRAINLLQNLDKSDFSQTIRLNASYFKAMFICEDRGGNLGYPIAYEIFENIQKSKSIPGEHLSKQATYQIALMRAKGQIQTNDYSQVADVLLKIIKDPDVPTKVRAHANFYLSELVLNDCCAKVTKDEAFKFMDAALACKDLPKNMRRDGSSLLNSAKGIKNDSFSESEVNFTSASSTDFARTALMKNKIKKQPNYSISGNTLKVKGKDYHVISSKTINFNQPIASCGGSIRQETILLDPRNSPLLEKIFTDAVNRLNVIKLNVIGNITEDQAFEVVSSCVRLSFPKYENTTSKVNDFVSQKQTDKNNSPVIAIDNFITKRLGVCRHHALVTAHILYRLTQMKEFGLTGIVQIIRDNLSKGGAHAWVTYATKKRMVHIDTMWNKIIDFTGDAGKKIIESKYGAEVLQNQIRKIERALKVEPTLDKRIQIVFSWS